jgi:hypothetical protein
MKSAANRALAWHKEGKRGGTSVGFARANQISNGESLSDSTVKRMYSFFSRHEVDKKATGFNSGEEGYPSPGRVAWDLWGGDAGFAFARSKVKHTLKKMIEAEMEEVLEKSSKSISVGQMVSWGSSGGNATGKVVKVKKNGSIKVPNSSFTITGTKDNPAVLIRIYKDGKPTDTLVGHKMNTLNSVKKVIGGTSGQYTYDDEAGTPESYVRNGGEKENMSEKTTTEPDPKGDIAVLKSVDSDLARRKITKAIKSLQKAMANLPDTGRAGSVSVGNTTGPNLQLEDADGMAPGNLQLEDADGMNAGNLKLEDVYGVQKYLSKALRSISKAYSSLPDTSRAGGVSVGNATNPYNNLKLEDADGMAPGNLKLEDVDGVATGNLKLEDMDAVTPGNLKLEDMAKDVGDADNVKGKGANSQVANTTVDRPAGVVTKADSCGPDCVGDNCTKCAAMGITKAACCSDCGDNCTGGACCNKCMKMDADGMTPGNLKLEEADGVPSPASPGTVMKGNAADAVTESQTKTSQEMINDAKVNISKSVWGGAFGAPNIPRVK